MQKHHPDLESTLSIPVPSVEPSTIWGKVIAAEPGSATVCAACGLEERVVPDHRCADLPFCVDCIEHARTMTEWDDIGPAD